MIALDTNALVRVLVNDDASQAQTVRDIIHSCEQDGVPLLVLNEVLIETVWVLESVYGYERKEIALFLNELLEARNVEMPYRHCIHKAVYTYRFQGDFSDHLIVEQARTHGAEHLLSFDKKLQKMFPDFVIQAK